MTTRPGGIRADSQRGEGENSRLPRRWDEWAMDHYMQVVESRIKNRRLFEMYLVFPVRVPAHLTQEQIS